MIKLLNIIKVGLMMKKKIMLLGGNYFQMTATKAAKELGHYVISVDYLPDNPAHKYADEYHNVSTTDKETVLALAQKLHIDGILSYASDVSAPTAAYVAEKMGLPTNPLKSVEILTDKQKFRQFLRDNGFNVPSGKTFSDYKAAKEYYMTMQGSVIIKPTDSSGSKGVHRVDSVNKFDNAWYDAQKYSRNRCIFIEQYIQKQGYEIDADSFWLNDRFAFFGVMDQHNDLQSNPYVPIGLSMPSMLAESKREVAKKELTRLMQLLDMRFGACNIEYIFDVNNNMYILEVGPRNGGNLITDTIKLACGVDLAKYSIKGALGESCQTLKEEKCHNCVSSYVVHSSVSGAYNGLWISDDIKKDILRLDIFVQQGEKIQKFDNAGMAIGAAIIQFKDIEEMCRRLDNMEQYIKVLVSE